MDNTKVKKLYALGQARWYDRFKGIWNRLVASEAEAQFASFLKNNLSQEKTILDLGCGTGLNLEKIRSLNLRWKKYIGLDFSPDMLKIAKGKFKGQKNVEFKEQDITKLDNINGKFDIIICTWVLSHLHSPSHLVNEAQQLLNPDGKMFLIFFTKPKWFVNVWLFPLSRYLFKAKYVQSEEIKKFRNVKEKNSFSANITTTMEIET